MIKPPPLRQAIPGGFIIDDFTIDGHAGTATCPAGHTVTLGRPHADGARLAQFKTLCHACPLRERCTTGRAGRPEHAARLPGTLGSSGAGNTDISLLPATVAVGRNTPAKPSWPGPASGTFDHALRGEAPGLGDEERRRLVVDHPPGAVGDPQHRAYLCPIKNTRTPSTTSGWFTRRS